MAIVGPLLDIIRHEFTKSAPIWTTSNSYDDMPYLEKECNQESEFDPHQIRKNMIDRAKNGKSSIHINTCKYGQVLVIYDNDTQYNDIPWALWGRILRLYTESFSKNNKLFKIFFLASPHLREFPANGPIGPTNINGGYTYPCNHETIMIYRAEDATRVLIHELMHSCCLDKMENGVDQVEAETEAWAELIYIGLLSRGTSQFYSMLQKQSEWICNQNEKVKTYITTPKQFPWRYTIGKEDVWRRWNIIKRGSIIKHGPKIDVGQSLRLTCPPNATLKKLFGVSKNSTIL